MTHLLGSFAGKNEMNMRRINEEAPQTLQSPEGISALMHELWESYRKGTLNRSGRGQAYIVDLPPLTDEERRRLSPVASLYADLDPADSGCPV